jgi:hypothetical protein
MDKYTSELRADELGISHPDQARHFKSDPTETAVLDTRKHRLFEPIDTLSTY